MKIKTYIIIEVLLVIFSLAGCSYLVKSGHQFKNPILDEGPDPYVYLHTDGFYYCTVTLGDRIKIWKTSDFTNLANAESKEVWFAPEQGENSCCIWAPEIHFLDNTWYLYYTASNVNDAGDHNRYVFVLKNNSDDPLSTSWDDLGKIETVYPGIDGHIFSYQNNLYFLYSPYIGTQSGVMIARMKSPTEIEHPASLLALPKYEWEKTDDREIMEGPQFLEGPKDKLFIVYSAGACWDDNYGLGFLEANKNADLLDPSSWKRSNKQVFGPSVENGVYGPGHNSFTTSLNGEIQWIVYHAKDHSSNECAERSMRAQPFFWDENGYPDFGEPVSIKKMIQKPTSDKK